MNWQSRRVLVTGGAGFIGSELVAQLAHAGARVTVLDSLVNGKRANLDGLPAESTTLVVGDVRDETLARDLLREHAVVFHLACLGLRHSLHAPGENHEVNAGATLAWLQFAREARVERFVQVSSSEVYGTAQRAPIDESHPTAPATVYGAAKLAGESYALAMHRSWGLPVTVVRPFNAFGPRSHHEGDAGEVIPRFVLCALAGKPLTVFGDGTQTRDFTEVSDTARGIALAGSVPAAIGGVFNLASGSEISVLALARTIAARVAGARASGVAAPIVRLAPRPGDVGRLVGDAARARKVIGFAPVVTFDRGLDRLIGWYQAGGVAPEELLRGFEARNWNAP
ncbi:MAG: GDP-mannose 4,6-dehydratase [Burkholderiaceae bacterium]|nr:GDP-mannose 4,6-dehydratase [Burkholderiaceae bacterium]